MSDRTTPDFLARISERCAALGISESAASTQAFGHHKGIAHLRSGTKSPGIEFFVKLAGVLKVSPAWLAYGHGDARTVPERTINAYRLRYVGEVAAGLWLSQDSDVDEPVTKDFGLTPSPRWPTDLQFVVRVRGTSINRVAPDGSYLLCVDTNRARYHARDGDLVIVERRRYGGSEIERTAKRYRQNEDRFELWPDSTDSTHRPIIIEPHEPGEGTTIEIIGLVDRYAHSVEPNWPWMRTAEQ